ncbi:MULTISPECIES: hypothetical protein [Streptomyces]|uniref:Secreted protein n=1 Tax=Streptomyces thermogriseus TaxID=75292 RepID=A0ABP4DIR1_9ACTN|nr:MULTISPECIES: hypothetical protein [Streptomyces]MDN5385568.1 hypothetical protein [Streptomyces sp. LB8]
MKQRGRHRRRRRGRVLRAALAGTGLALTAAATLISTSQATIAVDPGALKPLTSATELDRLRLTEQPVPQRSLDRLATAMGRPVGVATVLESTDRRLRTEDQCSAEEKKALPIEPAATRAYCWDPADTAAHRWRPRSVTTSGDADDDGRWGAHRVILSGWSYDGGDGRGLARVAFVNADDPDNLTYTWALLVVPVDGGRDYRALVSQVSGMVWYRNKLLVTTSGAERDALYVYDLHRIQRATVGSRAVGRVPGGWSAHGYRWVLPAVASYRPADGDCVETAGPGGKERSALPCPNGLSLDRSSAPESLVASRAAPGDGDSRTLLWRYSLSRDSARPGLLATDSSGTAVTSEAYESRASGVRGVLSHRTHPFSPPDWYLGRPADEGTRGTLLRQDRRGAKTIACGPEGTHHCWGDGTGSLSYWQETGEIWSLSGRMLFALPLSSVDREMR